MKVQALTMFYSGVPMDYQYFKSFNNELKIDSYLRNLLWSINLRKKILSWELK